MICDRRRATWPLGSLRQLLGFSSVVLKTPRTHGLAAVGSIIGQWLPTDPPRELIGL